MSHLSSSNETNDEQRQPKPWLLKHYQEKRQQTVTLVKATVDQLVKEKQTVTIEAICRKSTEVDPDGRGIKKSAILENPEAHAYYCEHSTSYRNAQTRKRQGTKKWERKSALAQPLRIDPNRDVDRARYRYLQMTKSDIVERLLNVEQAYAETYQQLTQLQFQIFEQELQNTEQQQLKKRNYKQKSEGKNSNGAIRATE